jgi:hypothetical protein
MEQHQDWYAKKRRDLARSTCSPTKSVAHEARDAKRNVNRRQRRAQKILLVEVRKNRCFCFGDADQCPRCDLETSLTEVNKSRPKSHKWFFYSRCYHRRWEWDKFSQIFRWADSLRSELSQVEMMAEILDLGKSPAHKHAIFHLNENYFGEEFSSAPKMSVASLKAAFLERGVTWRNKPKSQLKEIALRVCTHGSFHAVDQWATELCVGLQVLRADEVSLYSQSWKFQVPRYFNNLDCNWRFKNHECYYSTYESAYRPLHGIADVEYWVDEMQRLFDTMWGPNFLETPQGRWIIGELVKSSIPRTKQSQ